MKSIGYSPSTTLAQGELLAFHMTQHLMNDEALQTGSKDEKFVPNQHLCIGVLPFDVMVDTLDISIQKDKVHEVDFYQSGKEIARWLIKKSEYNKPCPDFYV
ncbi:hypothetical protein [Lysinibacillus irui]|uniref:hypothetical protein n=1 Tax=Lysinibacillus irui TaxID=2998077 RepID=UPI002AD56A4F|nr:hypothetical protein [Lysinibacillus irui]MEA0565772.1 hypothetical protein [Lysinibacillus irui]